MKFFSLATIFLLIANFEVSARDVQIVSPNGKLIVNVSDQGDKATYSVSLDGNVMIMPSALGFKADFGDFIGKLTVVDTKEEQIDRTYEMRQAKQSKVHFVAHQSTIDFVNVKNQKMSVQFVVSNNDVAFRYLIPRQTKDNPKVAVIYQESTAFTLPGGTTTFVCPQSNAMVGWERTKPSYEEEYKPDAPMNVKSQFGQGYTFPCLFHEQTGWVLISETGVSSKYCASHLSDYHVSDGDSLGSYRIAYPMPGENNGRGDAFAGISLPGSTPWRTITVGSTLRPIVETTIPFDVVEPLYEPSEKYASGRYTWSWLIWQDNSVCWDDQIKFIDLAAEMGYEYCLVDGFWDTQIGRDRMPALSQYAQQKGVALMLWYNSNGLENDAPQTPIGKMDNSIVRDQEMAWLKRIGVKGIKVDFFGGDKQETMKLYEDILFDANRYGIQCIFHGCTLPRGWERMYPNYVASEAVLASENVYFSDYHANQESFQLTMHPFCRNAVGSMDWGGIIMNKYMSRNNKSRHMRQTTNVFEIASGFINQSSIQCVAMQPNNLQELSEVEIEFLKTLPTTWDETRLIDGYPGRYVVMARRHADKWYVAGLNAQKEPLTLSFDLSQYGLKTQLVDQTDKKGNVAGVTQLPVKVKKGKTQLTIQPNGGVVVF